MRGSVVSGGRIAVACEPPGSVDVDEVVGDRPTLRVGEKVTLQLSAVENDQIAERKRQSDQLDRPRWRELRRGARRDLFVPPAYRCFRLV
jgi:hypothetical protein